MVEDPDALGPTARVLSLNGKYCAYSESMGVMEAIGEARLVWKRQLITAQMVQADLVRSVIRARGQVRIESQDKKRSVTGDQFALDMMSDQAKLVSG